MNQMIRKYSLIISVFALMGVSSFGASRSLAQESDDAMNDFLSEGATTDSASGSKDTVVKEKATAPKAKVPKSPPGEVTDPAAPTGVPPSAATSGPTSDAEFVDMRTDAPAPGAVPQSSPALDKLEALLIADAEMKAFMKAGGLRSRKIKP